MEGTIDKPLSYFGFKGIAFQHAGWLRPSKQGHVPLQAGLFLLDAYKLKVPGTPEKKSLENQGWTGRPAAAVEAMFTAHTTFESCRFEHLASTGLDYKRGNSNDTIEGNLFKDVGGSAILTGVFSDDQVEAHLSYNPADLREVSSNTTIRNNLVTDVTNEDWGAVGIGAGFVRGITIEHNDISEVSYSGISLGWGWTKEINVMRNNLIRANKIYRYARNMYDVAGIYTLSAQPGSEISENYIDSIYKAPYSHDPHHWFYLYEDEGSSFFTVRDNWCPAGKFLQNANGPGNVWTNNGPQVADSIRSAAGLQDKYKALLAFRAGPSGSVNSVYEHVEGMGAKPMAIEVVSSTGRPLDRERVRSICRQHGIASTSVFEWNNRIVIFDDFLNEAEKIRKKLADAFPKAEVNVYNEPFYTFSLKKSCPSAGVAAEWDHAVLIADLVNDTKLQKEYMDLHVSQFAKWPEVTKGFCNAQFQQVLVFRNNRQLLLVLSVPRGKSLDQLNQLTVKGNPRAAEWNELMKKYQQPVAGATGTDTWVRFEPIDHKGD
ncbi:right-handed parallel beta-helix repeat-containing protein [Arcticibacter sp. MXS-1]|uniref:right-handed parallel beta-helix repeat-containing protein n=1 Tax=Arcticibacter sp. MXS-1 TaxID=3341726 RepID=UPI0035A8B431